MNQAYFTFCCSGAGNSLSGLGGDRVRAAVKGTSETELARYKQYCNYPQYSQTSKSELPAEIAANVQPFAKLVFGKAETGSGFQRFLAHSVYARPDKETLREGNYFSHLLYSLPNAWTVRTALQMWGSPFWVTQDSDDISPELSPIDDSDVQFGIINENSFVEFLRSDSERQKKFLFLLKSLLTLKSGDKIVLTGLPGEAAFCLWGATRCLPLQLWNNITFSTHEKPSLSFSFDVVNYPLSTTFENQDEYIFSELPRRPNIRFYSSAEQLVSTTLPDVPFADEILEISVNGTFQLLDEFYKNIPAAYYNAGSELQLFWTFINHPKQISCNDIDNALKVPELKNQAVETLMDNALFSLDEQLRFYSLLDASRQDTLLNRLISENSIEQIRSNEQYSKLLISALTILEEQNIPEKKTTLLQKFLQIIIGFIKK